MADDGGEKMVASENLESHVIHVDESCRVEHVGNGRVAPIDRDGVCTKSSPSTFMAVYHCV